MRAHVESAGLAALAVVTVLLVALAFRPPGGPTADDTAASGASGASRSTPSPSQSPSPQPPRVLVLGDSFTSGTSANTKGREWPRLLADATGWSVSVRAARDTGFVATGSGGSTLADRALRLGGTRADVVVIAGGHDDVGRFGATQVAAAATQTVRRAKRVTGDAQVVLVSPFSSGRPGPLTRELDDAQRAVAAATGVPYVDATGFLDDAQVAGDGVHPDDSGQRALATKLEKALRPVVRRAAG